MTVSKDVYHVGVNDRNIDLFEGQYIVKNGMAYNSYVIIDEKVAVMDTVDKKFGNEWLNNLKAILGYATPDYLIVQHMEPDHSANIENFAKTFPNAKIVGNAKTLVMIKNFFPTLNIESRWVEVKNGESLSLGKHNLTFVFAPMVHWPEVMVTYDNYDKILFSADGFGKFGAQDANEPWIDEARRYYIGIVGKYGNMVQNLLKVASTLDIQIICPLHGPVLKDNLNYYINLYNTWSSYSTEKEGVMIAYTSVYGNTKMAALTLAEQLKKDGAPEVKVYDLARCDTSQAVADAFAFGKIVLATTTYNAEIFPFMRDFVEHLVERNYQNKTVAIIENGSWAPYVVKYVTEKMSKLKNIKWTENNVLIKSAVNAENYQQILDLSKELCKEYTVEVHKEAKQDMTALFKIGYGLYVVTTNDGNKDNGCIVNTVSQVTNTPNRIAITVNKTNYTHDIIKQTGILNVNCLSTEAPFKVFETFGFQSGKTVNKFEKCTAEKRSANGLVYLPKYINAYMSLKVENSVDLGTHTMFICTVTEAETVSKENTMTYNYYQENVKPKPTKKGWVCKVCGYVYEGEDLPENFVCPLCKHGAEDFEKVK